MAIPNFRPAAAVPREAGAIFARTRPMLAVCSHVVHLSSDWIPPGPVEPLIAEAREKNDEGLEIGEDLTTLQITDTERVTRWAPLTVVCLNLWLELAVRCGCAVRSLPRKQPCASVPKGARKQVLANLAIPVGGCLMDNSVKSITYQIFLAPRRAAMPASTSHITY